MIGPIEMAIILLVLLVFVLAVLLVVSIVRRSRRQAGRDEDAARLQDMHRASEGIERRLQAIETVLAGRFERR